MIIKRQKTYSSKGTKVLFRLKKVADQVGTAVNNAGLKTGDKIAQTITGKPVRNSGFRFRPKSDMQLKRETISTANKINQTKNAVVLEPERVVGETLNETVIQPAKHAPLGTIISQASPIPGSGLVYATKVAPKEALVYDKLGIGKVFKPVREGMDKYVNNDSVTGAVKGVVGGLKTVIA